MSETLEQRIRREGADPAHMLKVFTGDVVELLDAHNATITAQAAEIARLTARTSELEIILGAYHECHKVAWNRGDLHYNIIPADLAQAATNALRPQPQPAQPETPTLSRYHMDIIRLATGEITEREFAERQGRRPV